MLINPILSDQLLFTTSEPTFKDLILSDFAGGSETIDEILDDIIPEGILDAFTVNDATGITITWSAGEVWDSANKTIAEVTAEATPQNCTDDAVNYLKWVSGTTLTLGTALPSGTDVIIASINCADGDIWEINQIPIISDIIGELAIAFQEIFPSLISSGLIVSEHADDEAFDVDMSEGVYFNRIYGRETVSAQDSSIGNDLLITWYKSAASEWTATADQSEIDETQWNNGTALAAVGTPYWYRSLFFVTDDGINWVYPSAQYTTKAQAIAGADPELPAGLTDHPKSTVLILQWNAAALPTAAGDQWIDVRPIIGSTVSGDFSDHGNLAGLGDDDHPQYLTGATGLFIAVTAQTLTAGDAIVATDGEVWTQIDSAGAITLTSEPHIAAGRNGQVIRLHNTGSYNIILQDVNVLGGSLMRFNDDTVTIEPAGTLELVYDSDVSFWVQTALLNPQTFTPSISSFTAHLGTTREVAAATTEDTAPNFTIAYVGTPSACSIDVSSGGDPAAQWPIIVPSPYTALNAGTTPTTDTFYRQTTVAATRVFTATATVAGTGGLTATITYTYYNRRYVGPSSDGAALTTAEILALDDTAAGESGLSNSGYGTFTDIDTAAGEYIYYCYRSALGTVSYFSIENEVAAFTDEGTAVTHTNDQGFAETFQQYRSDNTNFGANKDFRALAAAANNRIFCGPHTDAQIDDSGILEIDDTADGESIVSSTVARTYTDIEITGSEYLWLCHPDRVSDISTIKDGTTGFAIAGSYRTNVSHTNQYGYTETYRCWRSDNVAIYPTGEDVVVT